jgi:hypothetical protein
MGLQRLLCVCVLKAGQAVLIYSIKALGLLDIFSEKGMTSRLVTSILIIVIIGSVGTAFALDNLLSAPEGDASEGEIVCPEDGSIYIWTPIGSYSENFNWICLQCGHRWMKIYPDDVYQAWLNTFLEPSFVRDYMLLYLKMVLRLDVSDSLLLDWNGGRETPEGIVGYETYVYRAGGIVVNVGYPVVRPDQTVYRIKVEVQGQTVWEGELQRRQFLTALPPQQGDFTAIYDCSGGVGLFDRGIYVVATSENPLKLAPAFEVVNEFWQNLKEHTTVKATTDDFISIIISRGDYPTGGYTIQVESFSWLESYPVKFRFHVNLTDPGEGVIVTQALTNPLVLIPIGNLDPGEYVVEVHVAQYILTFDEQGNPVYTQLQTFKEEVWTLSFVIE